MTNERRDELLTLVREQGDSLRKLIIEQRDLFLEERKLNNDRFTQLATGLMEVRGEVSGNKGEISKLKSDLTSKIDEAYHALSEDIQVFAEDLYQTKRRVTRIEKKLLS